MARLLKQYREEVIPAMSKEFSRKNAFVLPRLDKICLNTCIPEARDDQKTLVSAQKDMTLIAGQAVAVTAAKISVANFHLREGMRIGCRVTLRGLRMYEFFDRLVTVAIPRIRDFRGLNPRSFDSQGNYSFGIEEQTIFPEVDPDRTTFVFGMDVTFVIKQCQSADEGRRLLTLLGLPLRDLGGATKAV